MRGRPTEYNAELADLICELVSTNEMGIKKLCELYPQLPDQPTIDKWRLKHSDFAMQYAKAKVIQANLLAESIIDIVNSRHHDQMETSDGQIVSSPTSIARDRLIVDTYKWIASKLVPKIYGKDVELEMRTQENEQLKQELKVLRDMLDDKYKRDY